MTGTRYVLGMKTPELELYLIDSLSYAVYLWTNIEIWEPEAEADTHASFESGFRNNSIVQNNNYSFFFYNYQNTLSFLAPLYTFVCFEKAPL